jgi:hypothetical protein
MNETHTTTEPLGREDDKLQRLAQQSASARDVAARMASSSEETAELFSSGHTLAADNTGDGQDQRPCTAVQGNRI